MSTSSVPADTNEVPVSSAGGSSSSDGHGNGLRVVSTPEDTHTPTGHSKVSYSRIKLIELKESKLPQEYFDDIRLLTTSKILFKILKPECKLVQRQSKAHDNSGIVLGPQKRSWNIGCHVSQSKRSPQESSGQKCQKGYQESKFSRGDFKRDSRGSERSGKSGFNSNGVFSRCGVQEKGDSSGRFRTSQYFHSKEKEPEWFTEGPETITDTVELGRLIEDDVKETKQPQRDSDAEPLFHNPLDVDSSIISTGKIEAPQPSIRGCNIPEFGIPQSVKPVEEGSRFRHLFDKSITNTPKTGNVGSGSGNMNSRLLQMLACSGNSFTTAQPTSSTSQPSPNQLESALRSLVLRGDNATQVSPHSPPVHIKESDSVELAHAQSRNINPRAPTVEEIEAAAFTGVPRPTHQAASQPYHCQQQSQQTPPTALLNQLVRSFDAKQQNRPLSCNFDMSSGAPISLDALEAMQLQDHAIKFDGANNQVRSDNEPPGLNTMSQQHNATTSPNAIPSSALLQSMLAAKMRQQPQQYPQSFPHQSFTSQNMMSPPGILTTDPAIAFHAPQRRPIFKNPSMNNTTHSDAIVAAMIQRHGQQPQSFGVHNNQRFTSPGSRVAPDFRPDSNMEAALMQLKMSVDVTNNTNLSEQASGPFLMAGIPPNPPYSFRGGTYINSNCPHKSVLEQLLINSNRAQPDNVGTNTQPHQQPTNMRQNLSAPDLLLPPRWRAAATARMLRSRGGGSAESSNP